MKKVIILTSSGGRGHLSVSKALRSYLEKDYSVKKVFFFADVLKSFDLAQLITLGKYTGEDLYNILLRRKHYRLLNMFYTIGNWYFGFIQKRVGNAAKHYLEKEKPDLVISVIPIANEPIAAAARALNIPCLIIPTDLDNRTFIQGMRPPYAPNFQYTLPFGDSDVRRTIEPAHIPAAQVSVTGFVVRQSFFEPKDHAAIKETYNIYENKPVVLVMLGGLGSEDLVPFAQQLAALPIPAHFIFCIGKHEAIRSTLEAIPFPAKITRSIIGFTEHISDLMAVSDVCITKSGSVSVCEALRMRVPLILDATSGVLAWEAFNHRFIQKRHLGLIVRCHHDLVSTVMKLLGNSERLREIKKNLLGLEQRDPRVCIPELIRSMLGQ
jgi:processive 1,2-diacylglycerol beta-glucosyltransferase